MKPSPESLRGLLIAAQLATCCATSSARDVSSELWYRMPGTCFEESLVLGNGTLGASVFGGTSTEKIILNDATFWSGEPVDPKDYLEMHKNLSSVREALVREDYMLADQLIRKMQGRFTESYCCPGSLLIDFHQDSTAGHEIRNYTRSLDLKEAVSRIAYEAGGVKYSREYFVSHPDKVLVIRLSADRKGALDFTLRFESPTKCKTEARGATLLAKGYAPYHVDPPFLKDVPDPIRFDPARGTRFTAMARIQADDGSVTSSGDSVTLSGGTEALIVVSMATSFNGFDRNPATEGRPDGKIAEENLTRAMGKTYDQLRRDHIADYAQFYNRVHLDLGGSNDADEELPTDERLKRYTKGATDKGLEALYFNFGRYLLISSSRTPGAPANLQGIWNDSIRPPWACNYTLNINLEENYWPAEVTNLGDLCFPLFDFIGNLSKTGAVTARAFYGAKGWTAAHTSDIWAMSNPVGDFGKGNPAWANWTMGGAWLTSHLWEHYAFTRDTAFLREKAYPLMKGAATFCLDMLVKDKEGFLVTSPSTSPEHKYRTPDGYTGATLYGSTADLAIIRECFRQTIAAARILGTDADFQAKLEKTLARLHPYRVGRAGSLQEWYHDWEDFDPQHRHQSHLIGLYPGEHLHPETTPELAKACAHTLEVRGENSTGWSKGWRAALWARLRDGERAYRNYRQLLTYIDPGINPENLDVANGTYPNLLNGPPYQIDGNLSGTAALAEMLLQSDDNGIRLLPAAPSAWSSGSVHGLRARGNFTVDFAWKEGKVTDYRITSEKPRKVKLHLNGVEKEIISQTRPPRDPSISCASFSR